MRIIVYWGLLQGPLEQMNSKTPDNVLKIPSRGQSVYRFTVVGEGVYAFQPVLLSRPQSVAQRGNKDVQGVHGAIVVQMCPTSIHSSIQFSTPAQKQSSPQFSCPPSLLEVVTLLPEPFAKFSI